MSGSNPAGGIGRLISALAAATLVTGGAALCSVPGTSDNLEVKVLYRLGSRNC
jgi:hypothetical protein